VGTAGGTVIVDTAVDSVNTAAADVIVDTADMSVGVVVGAATVDTADMSVAATVDTAVVSASVDTVVAAQFVSELVARRRKYLGSRTIDKGDWQLQSTYHVDQQQLREDVLNLSHLTQRTEQVFCQFLFEDDQGGQ